MKCYGDFPFVSDGELICGLSNENRKIISSVYVWNLELCFYKDYFLCLYYDGGDLQRKKDIDKGIFERGNRFLKALMRTYDLSEDQDDKKDLEYHGSFILYSIAILPEFH